MIRNLLVVKEEERVREWRKKRLHWVGLSVMMFALEVLTGISLMITITKGH
jgi:hypothetical protein